MGPYVADAKGKWMQRLKVVDLLQSANRLAAISTFRDAESYR